MTDRVPGETTSSSAREVTILEFGGLHFEVSFRDVGATLRVCGRINGGWTEMLRFDDFIDNPHFHAPPSEGQISFYRASLGEPLSWYVSQIRDHLTEWLHRAGFSDVLPTIDVDTVSANADELTTAMIACVPQGFVRVPGLGIQRAEPAA